MAKGKGDIKGWITKNGVHIPIYGSYTVREGHEPTAKGAKFNRKKRKPLHKMSIDELREEAVRLGADKKKLYGTSKDALMVKIGQLEKEQASKNTTTEDSVTSKGKQVEGKGAVKDVKGNNPVTKSDPYDFTPDENSKNVGRNVLGQEVDWDKVAKTAKEREKDFIVDVHIPEEGSKEYERFESWRKAMEAADEADAYDRQYKEGKYADSEQTEEGKKPVTKAEEKQESSKAANGAPRVTDEEALSNKEVEWNGQRYQTRASQDWDREKNQEYTAGHLYVPIDPEGDAKQFFVAQDGSVHGSASEYLNKRAAARRAEKSSTPTSTPERKRYKSDGLMQAFKSAKEMTGRSDLEIHQLAQDGLEDHYSFRDKDGNEVGTFSNPHTSKKGYMTLNAGESNTKQDSLSAGTNERSRIRGELHAKDKAMKAAMPTTVSGLRSAYADATGSMKSKIAAELRRKGYSLVGGKWVKGSKS